VYDDEVAVGRAWERPEAVTSALDRYELTADKGIRKHSRKVEPAGTK
jgi:hypothetical protein